MRRATRLIPADVLEAIFQSTLSMRRATEPSGHVEPERNISIHALHEESDAIRSEFMTFSTFQSTLSMRRATRRNHRNPARDEFQSTLSMRRATWRMRLWRWRKIFQSTLSMRRATFIITQTPHYHQISIHALHEESDSDATTANSKADSFQSTLSMRRATKCGKAYESTSIYFNPRSP